MKSLFKSSNTKSLFDNSLLIQNYISIKLSTLSESPSENIKIIDAILKKIAPFKLITINALLNALKDSFSNKIEKKMFDLVFNITTVLNIEEKYQLYIDSKGTYPINVKPYIKDILNDIIKNLNT
jgi:hypothetical protein